MQIRFLCPKKTSGWNIMVKFSWTSFVQGSHLDCTAEVIEMSLNKFLTLKERTWLWVRLSHPKTLWSESKSIFDIKKFPMRPHFHLNFLCLCRPCLIYSLRTLNEIALFLKPILKIIYVTFSFRLFWPPCEYWFCLFLISIRLCDYTMI